VVAFITDFGLRDHYASVVKARILKEIRESGGDLSNITFLDLTHEVPPQKVKKGALLLKFSYKYFPEGTIFLGIIDPGVGTPRRALLLETPEYLFIGPDNGLFTFIYQENPEIIAYEILVEKVLKPPYSSTFHGRDLFAPVVARILLNEDLKAFSRPLKRELLLKLDFPLPEKSERGYRLSIWEVDHFGNLITNFSAEMASQPFEVYVNGKRVPLVKTYAEGEEGEVMALFGSEGLLEIAQRNGSAFKVLGYPEVEIRFK